MRSITPTSPDSIADRRFHQHRVPITIDRVDDRLVALLHDVAADLAGSRDFAVVGIEFLVQADEFPQLQSGWQRAVDVLHGRGDQGDDLRFLRQVGIGNI